MRRRTESEDGRPLFPILKPSRMLPLLAAVVPQRCLVLHERERESERGGREGGRGEGFYNASAWHSSLSHTRRQNQQNLIHVCSRAQAKQDRASN
uniref:Uncharacterized protein n=1 Tax=Oryza nivara TaxID=4536 RepID=A0A0E0I400_ORYNI